LSSKHSSNSGILRLIVHGGRGVAKMGSGIHGETSSAATETVSLRTVLPAVALFAVDLRLVLSEDGGVKFLIAESALETGLVELAASGEDLLSGVNGFTAFGALHGFGSLEGHFAVS